MSYAMSDTSSELSHSSGDQMNSGLDFFLEFVMPARASLPPVTSSISYAFSIAFFWALVFGVIVIFAGVASFFAGVALLFVDVAFTLTLDNDSAEVLGLNFELTTSDTTPGATSSLSELED